MTPVVTHNTSSSEDSDSSVGSVKQMARIDEEMEDCDPRDLDLSQLIMTDHGHQKPKTKAMRGSSQLMVPRPADSRISAANRLIGEVVQSRRRPLLGPSPG